MPSRSRYTYKRKRPAKRARVEPWPPELTRLGYTPRDTVLRGTRRRDGRPSLQVINYTWKNDGSAVTIGNGGGVYLLTEFPRGDAEDQRHTGETLTYKVSLNLQFAVQEDYRKYCNRAQNMVFLVYDAQPTGTNPKITDIFHIAASQFFPIPATWMVSRENSHRFVIKRKWMFITEVNGSGTAKDYTNAPCYPAHFSLIFKRFVQRLGVRTEWKNSTEGGIGAISKGAMYLIIAPGNGMPLEARGNIRLYFKSIGNQ
ncbi:capsid protein [Switchgrass mosaic-associated virus 1]|uniref:Capsid protein n=1 Tax=Switchgrass mosaic-associated virus 1 TaxID=1571533 RepID=A0A0A0QVW5_9GEMI|nr:capsid protein [Switchgrass mosaic-associated virus 1]AIT39767.1 capsid protein [Switchgrass mosaic-associated virus 1]